MSALTCGSSTESLSALFLDSSPASLASSTALTVAACSANCSQSGLAFALSNVDSAGDECDDSAGVCDDSAAEGAEAGEDAESAAG